MAPESWVPKTLAGTPQKTGCHNDCTYKAGMWSDSPRNLGFGIGTAPRKLKEDSYSPQEAGYPRKLPSQAAKAGFNYMQIPVHCHVELIDLMHQTMS